MKVLLSAPMNTVTGYGVDGVELAQALLRWGADVYVHPSSVQAPLPPDVAALLTKEVPDRVDLLISHRCPQELSRGPFVSGTNVDAAFRVAWTMWEWDSLLNIDEVDENLCEHSFKVLDHVRAGLDPFDLVLAYDEVSLQALAPYHGNVTVLQGGVVPLAPLPRLWQEVPFRFLMTGALTSRKNPFAAVTAFRRLREAGELADAQLVLKTTRPGLHPAMEQWTPGLKIVHEVWPTAKLHALYAVSHVLLAPSWGEGKNRPAIEFATSGGAVAATHVGGHAQWMSPEYSWPLRFELTEMFPGGHAAVVDPDHLAETMLSLYNDRAETERRGQVASQTLPAMISWVRVLERLCEKMRESGERGEEIAMRMRMCRKPEEQGNAATRSAKSRDAFDRLTTS